MKRVVKVRIVSLQTASRPVFAKDAKVGHPQQAENDSW
jgi:hypothetical protein